MKTRKHEPILLLGLTLLTAALVGCQCTVGQKVTIPASDTTDPIVVMDLHLPNGNIVTVTPAGPTTVNVPGGGTVTILASAEDPEGARDAQIWAASIVTRINPNGTATTSGPGLLGRPTASDSDSHAAGQSGCTKRLAKQNVTVSRSPTGSTSFEVSARAVNFGGRTVSTALVRINAQ